MKNKICPNCGEDLEIEDNRCDTDRGIMGDKYYYCPRCDHTEDFEEVTEDIRSFDFTRAINICLKRADKRKTEERMCSVFENRNTGKEYYIITPEQFKLIIKKEREDAINSQTSSTASKENKK